MTAREALVSEKTFHRQVEQLLAGFGWLTFHDQSGNTSGTGAKGWPDIFAVRDGDAVVLELKTMTGRATPQQHHWLRELQAAGIEARVIRPSDIRWLEQRLAPKPLQLVFKDSRTAIPVGLGCFLSPSLTANLGGRK